MTERILPAAVCVIAVLLGGVAKAEAAPNSRLLWSQGDRSVWAMPCPAKGDVDADCEAIEARAGKTTAGPTDPDYGYLPSVHVLWKQAVAGIGPDLIVEGDSGGSAGYLDVYGITFGPTPHMQRLASGHFYPPAVRALAGLPHFELGFAIEGFDGADDAATPVTGLPIHWNGHALDLDMQALPARKFDAKDLASARLRAARELRHFLTVGSSQATTQFMVETMLRLSLSGHADKVHAFLEAVWPRAKNRKAAIETEWRSFCRAVTRQEAWRDYRLSRIPNADVLLAGAR
jgi:hypothetical protein